jgi:antitoxin VapB
LTKLQTAKIFWSGRSQAVRLPKDFRFEGSEVLIRREGESIVLEPVSTGWDWLSKMPGQVDADFETAAGEQPDWPAVDPAAADLFK